jgi:hypothetical protein
MQVDDILVSLQRDRHTDSRVTNKNEINVPVLLHRQANCVVRSTAKRPSGTPSLSILLTRALGRGYYACHTPRDSRFVSVALPATASLVFYTFTPTGALLWCLCIFFCICFSVSQHILPCLTFEKLRETSTHKLLSTYHNIRSTFTYSEEK